MKTKLAKEQDNGIMFKEMNQSICAEMDECKAQAAHQTQLFNYLKQVGQASQVTRIFRAFSPRVTARHVILCV